MQLFISGSSQTHVLNVEEDTFIRDIKNNVASLEGIAVEDQVLSFGGSILCDDVCVKNIPALSTISLTHKLLGGKVHGSLARAGKVRGQTPKVDKAEGKKKQKTGRAKRRMQYNRRFVNVVATAGRRRGPNANS